MLLTMVDCDDNYLRIGIYQDASTFEDNSWMGLTVFKML